MGFPFRGKHKLQAAQEFSTVFSARKVLRSRNFDLHYFLKDDATAQPLQMSRAQSARLGLVIAKRLARHAVHRNLLKRLAREAFRHARPELLPYDLVIRLSKPIHDELDRSALRIEIEELLRRLPVCGNC